MLPLAAPAQGAPIPPAPSAWVTDGGGFLSRGTARSLNERLGAYQQASGHQVLVWIGKTSGGDPVDDWAPRVFKAWRIGRKGYDDGLILFVLTEDRTARIEVGYGLEGQIPDATASRLINEVLIPGIKSGDADSAVSSAVDGILGALGGEAPAAAAPARASPLQIVVFVLIVVVIAIIAVRHPVAAYYLIMFLSSLTGRGSGGSDAGGRGGRSGGAGATGKW